MSIPPQRICKHLSKRPANELESLDEKYKDMTANDIEREIIHYTTGTPKDEAGAARGAGIVDAGFKAFLDQLVEEVGTAK
jgi:hypothetical protein